MAFPVFSGITLMVLLMGPYYLVYNMSSIFETTGTNPLLFSSISYSVLACFLKSLLLASIPIPTQNIMEYLSIITKVIYLYFIRLILLSKNAKNHEVNVRINVGILGWCIAHTALTYFIPVVTDTSLSSDFSLDYIRLILSSYSASLSTYTCFYCMYMLTKPNLYDRKGVIIITISSCFLIQLVTSGLSSTFGQNNIAPFVNLPIFAYLAFYINLNFNKKREKVSNNKKE
ncbi:uncharacterized protein cubi_03682 [Cryptosporidium ubiquitum]|uniref:Uncharacterized protein n=1 Tax=Cryptosporidium ubiquitum TaxID=857276 RepID=A0A1J4MIF1_9CRYT|nr:uncharacterized protein cubi_03682 [Cryptosporidium ubiquitum]OII72812.1 hypothetical protein cubi_03682 [Cryptosporidium ubiquitum]